jgi:uncharacterized protein YtpQ (UPF0354 family)
MSKTTPDVATGAAPLLSKEEFSAYYTETLRRRLPEARIEVNAPMQLSLKLDGGASYTAYLDNAYQSYRQEPGNLKGVVDRYLASMTSTIDLKAAAAVEPSLIVPVVKDRGWSREVSAATQEAGHGDKRLQMVIDDLNEDLIVVYAEDRPESLVFFSEPGLLEAGVPRDGLRELAVENLMRQLPPIQRHGGEGVYGLAAGGNLEASLLLVPQLWTHEWFPVRGDLVVAIPARDLLFVTGADEPGRVEAMQRTAEMAYRESPYRLTPKLFRHLGGELIPFEPGRSRVLH